MGGCREADAVIQITNEDNMARLDNHQAQASLFQPEEIRQPTQGALEWN